MTVEGQVSGSEWLPETGSESLPPLTPRGVSILAPSEVIGVERRGGLDSIGVERRGGRAL
jgi:hypothetical protein